MKTGLLGGTFNPIHKGHLKAAEEACEFLGLDEVLFIPAGSPPLKSSDIAGMDHRLRMVGLAVASDPRFRMLDIEARRSGPSYTVDTLRQLGRMHEGSELVFILGLDSFLEMPRWKDFSELVKLADFAVLCRPPYSADALAEAGYLEADAERLNSLQDGEVLEARIRGGRKAWIIRAGFLDISATEIRRRLALGMSVSSLLPADVESYIITNGLYGSDIYEDDRGNAQ